MLRRISRCRVPHRAGRRVEWHGVRRRPLGVAAAKTATVKVDINDDGRPATLKIKAGPTNFKITNPGSG